MINLVKRNLEQQVLKNQDDIEAMKQIQLSGLKILDILSSSNLLPDDANKGDCYGVYTGSAYELYVYTSYGWLNLGEFPKQGPQGLTGNPGPQGIQGVSTRWYSGAVFPPAGVKDGDMFLNTSSYQVYIRQGSQWIPQTNIKGAAGRDGLNGNSITSIDTQHQGNETVITINQSYDNREPVIFSIPDGTPGAGFHIAHIYPDDVEGATPIAHLPSYTPPDPDPMAVIINANWPAATSDPSEAVLVKTTQDGDYIYVIIVDSQTNTKYWDNVGQIQSVQGPQGEPGTQIMDSEDITKIAAGAQYPNTYKLYINSIPYLTTAPVADNANGIKIVVLDAEPATYYDGYYYIITEE